MGNSLRCLLLVLAAIVLSGKLAELQPHVHAADYYCPACPAITGRRKNLDRGETALGYTAQTGKDPRDLAQVEFEAVVVAEATVVASIALLRIDSKPLVWLSPPSVTRAHAPDVPRGPPSLT